MFSKPNLENSYSYVIKLKERNSKFRKILQFMFSKSIFVNYSIIKYQKSTQFIPTFISFVLLLLLSAIHYVETIFLDEITVWLLLCIVFVCSLLYLLGTSIRSVTILLSTRIVCVITSSLLLFLLCFEIRSVVILYIIISWVYNVERMDAGSYLFAYSLLSSVPVIIYLCIVNYRTLYVDISNVDQTIITTCYLLLFVLFVTKLPLLYVYFWLVRAHVEAPTYGSILLAALLLKLGWYGCYRYLTTLHCGLSSDELLLLWSIWGCLGAVCMCSYSSDSKRVVALSSVSHISTTLTVLTGIGISISISPLFTFVHACSRGIIFLLVGLLFTTSYTRCLYMSTGITNSIIFIPFCLSLAIILGLPPFVGLYVELSVLVCYTIGIQFFVCSIVIIVVIVVSTYYCLLWLSVYLSTINCAFLNHLTCMRPMYLVGVILCNLLVLIGWLT